MKIADSGSEVPMDEEEMKKHLEEAERNKELNAHLYENQQIEFNVELEKKLQQT